MDLRTIKNYEAWLTDDYFDEETRVELKTIEGQEREIEDRFYRDLEFGTAGIRGLIGAGTNRMNRYTIRRVTQGLANCIKQRGAEAVKRGVVIAYDSRHRSVEFMEEAALVLAANGVRVYIFDELRPSPELSFAVRHLNAAAGIVITASHNPAAYNGYKVYWEDGAQIASSAAKEISEEISRVYDHHQISYMPMEEAVRLGLIITIGEEIDAVYDERVMEQSIRKDEIAYASANMKVIFTPLHGTGNKPVRRVLKKLGFHNVLVVAQQEEPDPEFSTVSYPNPEEREAFSLAIELAKREGAELILGTDPDCDRVGVVVKNKSGEYVVLTGNQTGALLVNYVLMSLKEKGRLPENAAIIKTIVTSEMGRTIAGFYGAETVDTLTGFKYIGERIKEYEISKAHTFIFGYEESFGYLAGTYARDKDAVVASALICEMAAYYTTKGMTLYEGLEELYKTFGYYHEELRSITLEGKDGIERTKQILNGFRAAPPTDIAGISVIAFEDYLTQSVLNIKSNEIVGTNLPQSDVIKLRLEDGSWLALRPSGTEPKLKIYAGVRAEIKEDGLKKIKNIIDCTLKRLD